jgi:hypothetical protein
MKRDVVHKGYLPFTARHIIQQAFELLNEPYGWGGVYGEQDCSRFVQEVFATVGIILPRNSSRQAGVGNLIGKFRKGASKAEKLYALSKKAISGITLLYLKGHIMLFMGMKDNQPYAVHAAWAYREPAPRGDVIRVINRVALTDLSLGAGTKRGSLLKRLRTMRVIGRR